MQAALGLRHTYQQSAQAAINTDSLLIAFVIMSSHVHIAVITSNPGILVQRIRSSYTQQFNDRYFRKGRMGDKYYFKLAMEGRLHITAAFSYIMRNPVHHRVCANPFAIHTLRYICTSIAKNLRSFCRTRG